MPGDAQTTITARVDLTDIADLTDPQQADLIKTNAQELTGDWKVYPNRTPLTRLKSSSHAGIAPTQLLGEALFQGGFKGLVTFSAAIAHYKNLVVFPQHLIGSRCSIAYQWTDQHGAVRSLKIP